MLTIIATNVNEALGLGTMHLMSPTCRVISPRGGLRTIEYREPVCTTYTRPMERVLFSPVRDANPFFHFFEALWMLAGRNDVKFLEQFNSNIANYSDDGETFHAPYGFRLRNHYGLDQFEGLIELLIKEPDTRRAVVSIWDPREDLNVDSKDIPCNDLLMFQIRDGKLNMTISCRSNDMIWGAYGANAVHFSMIQEYVAMSVGALVGWYKQISNSFHVYTDNPLWEGLKREYVEKGISEYYDTCSIAPMPMMTTTKDNWDIELKTFMKQADKGLVNPNYYNEPFFKNVACPMFHAWKWRKDNKGDTLEVMDFMGKEIEAEDWRLACVQWMERRLK